MRANCGGIAVPMKSPLVAFVDGFVTGAWPLVLLPINYTNYPICAITHHPRRTYKWGMSFREQYSS